MFENNLYRTLSFEQHEGGYCAEVEVMADHPIYAGHFPAQAVVPGVCTLSIVRELTARALGFPVQLVAIRSCKFVSALLPSEGLTITLETTLDGERLRCTVRRADETVLKLDAAWSRL